MNIITDSKLEILLSLDYKDIMQLCSIDKEYYRYCNNDDIYKKLLERDFPFVIKSLKVLNEINMTYRKFYEKLYRYIMNIVKIITDVYKYQMGMYEYMDIDKINNNLYYILIDLAINIRKINNEEMIDYIIDMIIIAQCLDIKYVNFSVMKSKLRNTYQLKDFYKIIHSALIDVDLFIYDL